MSENGRTVPPLPLIDEPAAGEYDAVIVAPAWIVGLQFMSGRGFPIPKAEHLTGEPFA